MASVSRTATIGAPVDKVFDFARDIQKLWTIQGDVGVSDVKLTPDGVGTTAHAKWVVLGFHLEGDLEYTEFVPNERICVKSSTGPVFTFTFVPVNGGTVVTAACEWHMKVPVVGAAADAAMKKWTEKDLDEWLGAVKTVLEGGSPPREPGPGAVLTRSVTVDAPVEKVFGSVLDLGTFLTDFPDVAVRDVTLTPDGVGSTARLYTHEWGLHMEGTMEAIEVVPNERIVVKGTFFGEHPVWTYTFAPEASGTRVTGQGEWHVKIPGVGKAVAGSIAKSHVEFLESALAHLKERVDAT